MALHFDVRGITDYHKNFPGVPAEGGGERWNLTTEALVFAMLVCGVQRITAKNFKEVAERVVAYKTALPGGIPVTVADVRAHIGLTTNVAEMGRAAFAKHLGLIIIREARWAVEREAPPDDPRPPLAIPSPPCALTATKQHDPACTYVGCDQFICGASPTLPTTA